MGLVLHKKLDKARLCLVLYVLRMYNGRGDLFSCVPFYGGLGITGFDSELIQHHMG